MNHAATWTENIAGKDVVFTPLTVRQRLALNNDLISRTRAKAVSTAKELGFAGREAADFVQSKAEDAERMSSLIMSCFTLEGALAVLVVAVGHESAEWIGSSLEPGEVSVLACRCLNVRVSDEKKEGGQGN